VCLFIVQQISYNLDLFRLTAAYVKAAFYKLHLQHFRYDSNELYNPPTPTPHLYTSKVTKSVVASSLLEASCRLADPRINIFL
jgi:hypothetical protein